MPFVNLMAGKTVAGNAIQQTNTFFEDAAKIGHNNIGCSDRARKRPIFGTSPRDRSVDR